MSAEEIPKEVICNSGGQFIFDAMGEIVGQSTTVDDRLFIRKAKEKSTMNWNVWVEVK